VRLEVDKMEFIVDKNKQVSVFKSFGNIAVLPYRFKQQRKGCWIYLPSPLISTLGIEPGKDGDLLVFVFDDEDLEHNFLVLTRDNFILSQLRPQLLSLKQKATSQLEAAKKAAKSTVTSTVPPNVKGDTNE